MRFFASKFAINVISSCGFGLETNSIQDEESEFSLMCRKAVDPSLLIAIKRIIRMIMPGIFKKLKMYLNPQDVSICIFFSKNVLLAADILKKLFYIYFKNCINKIAIIKRNEKRLMNLILFLF